MRIIIKSINCSIISCHTPRLLAEQSFATESGEEAVCQLRITTELVEHASAVLHTLRHNNVILEDNVLTRRHKEQTLGPQPLRSVVFMVVEVHENKAKEKTTGL